MLAFLAQVYGLSSPVVLESPAKTAWMGPWISNNPNIDDPPGPPWSHITTGAVAGSTSYKIGVISDPLSQLNSDFCLTLKYKRTDYCGLVKWINELILPQCLLTIDNVEKNEHSQTMHLLKPETAKNNISKNQNILPRSKRDITLFVN